MAMTTTLQIRAEVDTAVLFKELVERVGKTQGEVLRQALVALKRELDEGVRP